MQTIKSGFQGGGSAGSIRNKTGSGAGHAGKVRTKKFAGCSVPGFLLSPPGAGRPNDYDTI